MDTSVKIMTINVISSLVRLSLSSLIIRLVFAVAVNLLPFSLPAQETSLKGDISEIRRRGEIRILMTASPELDGLPRRISPRDYDRALLLSLAERLNVRLKLVYLERFDELIPALNSGQGDIIADNLGVYDERKKIISYTVPLCSVQDQIITGIKNVGISDKDDLGGKEILYENGTGYLKSLLELQKIIPSIRISQAPQGIDTETIMHDIAAGGYELAITDSNYTDTFLSYREDIKIVYTFPEKQFIAWALRKDSPGLLMVANKVISDYSGEYGKKISKGDLPEIQKRKILRVLTRNNPLCYFIHKGQLMGFEYELASEFARRYDLSLIMVVPPKWSDLIPWLIDGKGDIIAAAMGKTEKRGNIKEISFCEPYCETRDRIVGRKGEKAISSLGELKGRTLALRKNSGYWEKMEKLRDSISFNLLEVPENLETYEIIGKVAKGEYDLTVSDEHILKLELMRRNDIMELFKLEPPARHSWCVRAEDLKLKEAVDNFFKKEYRGLFFNCTYNKYYRTPDKIKAHDEVHTAESCHISTYDKIIRKYSGKYGFHWLLISSQIYQESRFNPNVISGSGARGLMQLLPDTAMEMGFKKIDKHDDNIHAGVKYLSIQKNKVKDHIRELDKLCFALASYNVGYGHLLDARRLAEKNKLDPNRWFQNVEKCMLMLEKPEYSEKAKFGFCRGSEPVEYVREIMLRFNQYVQDDMKKQDKKNSALAK